MKAVTKMTNGDFEKIDDINSEKEYRGLIRTIEEGKKPSKLLVYLMTKLEGYRQKRKMGWSRPQNKYGLNVFKSFYLLSDKDEKIFDGVRNLLNKEVIEHSLNSDFIGEVLSDENLMGFVFCHDFKSEGKVFEGFTLSLGRKSKVSKRFRDRIDLIFESEVKGEISTGFNRIRVYVDPFIEPIASNSCEYFELTGNKVAPYEDFFAACINDINSWNEGCDEARPWEHWTARYIDYFGPRVSIIKQSIFNNSFYGVSLASVQEPDKIAS